MKIVTLAFGVLIASASTMLYPYIKCCCEEERFLSQTFMTTRPVTENLPLDQALWHRITDRQRTDASRAFEFDVVYQASLPAERTRQFFLFECKEELLVAGDKQDTLLTSRDVRAEWLGLPDDYRGVLTINPEQRQFAWFLRFHQSLDSLFCSEFFENYWVNVAVAFVAIKNRMNVGERDASEPGALVAALERPELEFSKISNRIPSHLAFPAEIVIRLGRAYLDRNHFKAVYYSIFRIPGASKHNPHYLFSPVVGTNGHLGFGAGAKFQLLLNDEDVERQAWCWFINLESTYIFDGKEWRTFDLRREPNALEDRQNFWSRYMLLRSKTTPAALVPAADILTKRVVVKPYNVVEFSTGLRIQAECAEFEIGYDIWGHSRERIKICDDFEELEFGIAGSEVGTTASQSTISTQAENDFEFVTIKRGDIDIRSAAAPSVFLNRIHSSFGFYHAGDCIDTIFGIGLFYETPRRNTALRTLGAWAKVGWTF